MGFSRPERDSTLSSRKPLEHAKARPGRVLGVTSALLTRPKLSVNCAFFVWWRPIIHHGQELCGRFEYPQREAAFFYGLFLRGHSAEELRRDIEVPLTCWLAGTARLSANQACAMY